MQAWSDGHTEGRGQGALGPGGGGPCPGGPDRLSVGRVGPGGLAAPALSVCAHHPVVFA